MTESEGWGLPLSLEPSAVLSPLFVCRYFQNCASVPGALIGVQWVDPGQALTQAAPSLPSTGERKFNKWFMGGDKGQDSSLTKYSHGENRLSLEIGIECITIKIGAG